MRASNQWWNVRTVSAKAYIPPLLTVLCAVGRARTDSQFTQPASNRIRAEPG